ncbi:MAG: hypothetical protein U0835_14135 [Isosphaeraceae bacterium]
MKSTRVSNSAGMILHHFDMETRARNTVVYQGNTYFGFFRREALADQVGIRDAAAAAGPTHAERARAFVRLSGPAAVPGRHAHRMIDRVETFVPDGGPAGLGFIEGTLQVRPESWFFQSAFLPGPGLPRVAGVGIIPATP